MSTGFVAVSLQVDLSRRSGAAAMALECIECFPGTRNASLTENGTAMFEMIFPGNLSALVSRLAWNLVPAHGEARVRLPVHAVDPATLDDRERVAKAMEEGPEIWDVQFTRGHYVHQATVEGHVVEATIAPSTNSMHHLYDSLLRLGIFAGAEVPAAQGV
jgi:hypothetical protein